MSKFFKQQGYSLLALLILVMMLGFAALEFRNNETFRNGLTLQQQARETKTLELIRSSLLGFAANQGLHSQSHLGHLPCPAMLPGQHAQTSCLNKPWGYLPIHSKIAVNYLNAGIDARFNELELSSDIHWQYAVSSQLVQPNALGWGRWVDYSKPSIQVRIPSENNLIKTSIVAVVAKTITPTAAHQYDISSPYLLVHLSELQTHMKQVQSFQLGSTLNTWKKLNPQFNFSINSHENMVPKNQLANVYQPVNSGCQCRCTKTRCSCHCNNSGSWVSTALCTDGNPNCTSSDTETICISKPGEPCVFAGPASLKNLWPVSHFEPVAASNKSCRPTQSNLCPLSQNSAACTCHFSWPDNTLSSLDQFSFKLQGKP
ncbi:MAG: hypothetical protein LW710_04905 [Burkholderiales bacterium]|jgi:hypothetical protein|uniref:hypothetical protein n=1 Tax=Limnobacter sp. TaxID=2003368 RepID=UPI0039575792|nr:hypothetical protein [Burkholderiales bacterium]